MEGEGGGRSGEEEEEGVNDATKLSVKVLRE